MWKGHGCGCGVIKMSLILWNIRLNGYNAAVVFGVKSVDLVSFDVKASHFEHFYQNKLCKFEKVRAVTSGRGNWNSTTLLPTSKDQNWNRAPQKADFLGQLQNVHKHVSVTSRESELEVWLWKRNGSGFSSFKQFIQSTLKNLKNQGSEKHHTVS